MRMLVRGRDQCPLRAASVCQGDFEILGCLNMGIERERRSFAYLLTCVVLRSWALYGTTWCCSPAIYADTEICPVDAPDPSPGHSFSKLLLDLTKS